MSLAENESDESEKTAQRDRKCSDVFGLSAAELICSVFKS